MNNDKVRNNDEIMKIKLQGVLQSTHSAGMCNCLEYVHENKIPRSA